MIDKDASAEGEGIGELADADLVLRTRSGDSQAYGELWRRHYRSGIAVARSVTTSLDADDLVQESYAKIYQSILKGGGPTGSFRAYLFTSIRNTAAGWGRARRESTIDELETVEDPSTNEQATADALDRSITAQAFRSLPTRWQEVLWYSEIEQMKPAEIAPLLGMKATAVAQLTFRAREGLREAWIQAHLRSVEDGSDCQWTIERLGAYARDNLGPRDKGKVDRHLAECARCAIVAGEAKEVSNRLALVLLPLTIGIAGTAGYLATLQGGGAPIVALAAMPSGVMEGAVTVLPGDGGATLIGATGAGAGSAAGSSTGGSAGAVGSAGAGAGGSAAGGGAAAGGAAAGGAAAGAAAATGGVLSGVGAMAALVTAGVVLVGGVVAAAIVVPALTSPPPVSAGAAVDDETAADTDDTTTEPDAATTAPTPSPTPSDIPTLPPVVEAPAPAPVAPNPAPVNPGPVDPGPVDPGPVDPGPVDPGPVDPGPVDPVEPTDPVDPVEPVLPEGTPEASGLWDLTDDGDLRVVFSVSGVAGSTVELLVDGTTSQSVTLDEAGAATVEFVGPLRHFFSVFGLRYLAGEETGPTIDFVIIGVPPSPAEAPEAPPEPEAQQQAPLEVATEG